MTTMSAVLGIGSPRTVHFSAEVVFDAVRAAEPLRA